MRCSLRKRDSQYFKVCLHNVYITLQAEEEQLAEMLQVNTPTAASLLTLYDYDLVLATKEGRTHRLCRYEVVLASR